MNQKGNALFLILIAVALFAALSYAVTQSGRSGGGVDKEQAIIGASQLTQYASQISQSIQRLKLLGGCTDNEISMWHDSNGDSIEDTNDDYYNATSPIDHSCHVFHTDGGAVPYTPPDTSWLNTAHQAKGFYGQYFFTGMTQILGVGTDTCPTVGCELLMYIPYLNKTIAEQVQKGMLSTTTIQTENIINLEPQANDRFRGVYGGGYSTSDVGDQSTMLAGKQTGCLLRPIAVGEYACYHVLIAR